MPRLLAPTPKPRSSSLSIPARRRQLDLNTQEQLVLYGLYKQATTGDAPKRGRAFSALSTWPKDRFWKNISTTLTDEALEEALDHIEQALAIVQSSSKTPYSPAATKSTTASSTKHSLATPLLLKHSNSGKTQESLATEEMLLLAAAEDDFVTIKTLLDQSAVTNIDYQDDAGQTALHVAADRGYIGIVQLLLDAGADYDAADADGISCLQAAVINGHVDVCQELLSRGADPDLPDQDGDTPRLCAMDDGSVTLRDLFAEYDAENGDDDDKDHQDQGNNDEDEEQSQMSWKSDFTDHKNGLPMVDCVPSSFRRTKKNLVSLD